MRKIIATALAVVLGAFVLACGGAPSGGERAVKTAEAGAPGAAQPAATTAAGKAYTTPQATDFTIKLNELSRQCFGSAGCNVEFSVELTRVNQAAELDPTKTWVIVYRVDGSEDEYTNKIRVTGGTYDRDESEMVQVKSQKQKLTPVIVSIVEG